MERLKIIRTYYESNMGKGLPEYGILGWESEEAQQLRFEILASSVDVRNKRLLDVGCGTGSLHDYLNQKGIHVDYTGVDILECMIDYAKGKNLKAKFHCVDIFKSDFFPRDSFDVVYASGIFNLNLGNNMEFLSEALVRFMELSAETVVFNLLNFDSPSKEEQYYYYHPDEITKLVEPMAHKLEKFSIIEHYLQNDFTVIFQKKQT